MVRNCNVFFFLNLVFGICISLSVQNKPIMSEVNMHDLSSLCSLDEFGDLECNRWTNFVVSKKR